MIRRAFATAAALLLFGLISAPAFAQGVDTPPASGEGLHVERVELISRGVAVKAVAPGTQSIARVSVRNGTDKPANDVNGRIETSQDGVRVTDGTASFGDVAPGKVATGDFGFVVAESGCEPEIGLGGTITSSLGDTPMKLLVAVACPGPRLSFEGVEYAGGDGDGVPEPGELVKIVITVHNDGADAATAVRGSIKVESKNVTVVDGTAAWPDVAPGSSAKASQPFVIQISPAAQRVQGCAPLPGGDQVVSSDGGVATDTSVAPNGTAVAGSPGSEPAGGGSDATGTGETKPPAPSVVEPVAPAPDGAPPPAGTIEPAPPEDSPAELSATVTVTSDGKSFELPLDNRVVCALTAGKGAPEQGAPVADNSRVGDDVLAGAKNRASGISVAVVMLLVALALASRLPRIGLLRGNR